eukprot:TRINITY_DN2418_c0_g1_i1.p1 TRINITY_DN2418_c0_g1~~TRINITY_DN2418_c0_g1_i1.p1  ORF type:complete len:130 (-),score=28.40 TRINITY_DN2418_c0_g1_i1:72-431(-)
METQKILKNRTREPQFNRYEFEYLRQATKKSHDEAKLKADKIIQEGKVASRCFNLCPYPERQDASTYLFRQCVQQCLRNMLATNKFVLEKLFSPEDENEEGGYIEEGEIIETEADDDEY